MEWNVQGEDLPDYFHEIKAKVEIGWNTNLSFSITFVFRNVFTFISLFQHHIHYISLKLKCRWRNVLKGAKMDLESFHGIPLQIIIVLQL